MVQNNAERCAKYRAENSEKFKLIAAIQQFKRSKELASESLDAEKMRRAAALRKRMQRERENEREMEREKSTGRIVTRGTESKNVNEGDNAQCIVHSAQCTAQCRIFIRTTNLSFLYCFICQNDCREAFPSEINEKKKMC